VGDSLQLTGALDDPSAQTLASAATVDIGASTSSLIRISGTTAITSLGTAPAGIRRKLLFVSSGVVLTYNAATLQLPTSANITAAANDTVDAYSLGSGNWLLHGYQRFSGAALSGASGNSNVFGELRTLPSRSITVPGIPYADGQLISSASTLYPDVVTNLKSATPSVPVTTPALWLSDPTLRACWAYDQTNDQIRVPDLNGKASGSIGPLMFRADGSLGFAAGKIRQDQLQNITGTIDEGGAKLTTASGTTGAFAPAAASTANRPSPASSQGYAITFDASRVARTGTETFPTHFVGVWGVVLFGAVINAGSVDAAALATKVANLESSLSKAVFGEMRSLPSRNITQPGIVYADGQLLSNASTQYPDAYAALQLATPPVPVTTAALWLSDPTLRGCWAVDTANNQIRVPDLNGKVAGSIGPVMFRADGTLGFAPGNIRQDQIQNIVGQAGTDATAGLLRPNAPLSGAFTKGTSRANVPTYGAAAGMSDLRFDASLVARTGTETFPTHVVGVWGVVLFGAVINAGAADAAALATSYASLSSRVQTLEGASVGGVDYVLLYPGGTSTSPDEINTNVIKGPIANPFPGHPVILKVEVYGTTTATGGEWADIGFIGIAGATGTYGVRAFHHWFADTIFIRSGSGAVTLPAASQGTNFTNTATIAGMMYRLHVWRVKG
jgi:hypothetical protein